MRFGPTCPIRVIHKLSQTTSTPLQSGSNDCLFSFRARCRAFSTSTRAGKSHQISGSSTEKGKGKGKGKGDEKWDGYEPVIGLELHVQLKSDQKLFSGASTSYEDTPNCHVAPFDAALPGSLPKLSPQPLLLALLAALALESHPQRISRFDRKHYFYPDLTPGWQITQRYAPLALGGHLKLSVEDDGLPSSSGDKLVRIQQIQVEQDTAKSIHYSPGSGQGYTLVDLNRAGTALIEIVSEPDMRSPEEASAFVRKLRSILRAIGASNGDMEKGSLRCDVNVSVRHHSFREDDLGTRCEIKNLNGVKFMMDAIDFEVSRHISLLQQGLPIAQETRGFDADKGRTFRMRSKEGNVDYRYMPDPELPPVLLDDAIISKARTLLPELPDALRTRLRNQYGLSSRDARILVSIGEADTSDVDQLGNWGTGAGARYFEEVAEGRKPKVVANWIIHELLGQLSKREMPFSSNPVSVGDMGKLIDAVEAGKLTGTTAKNLLSTLVASETTLPDLDSLIEENSVPETSQDDLRDLCLQIVSALPREAEKVRAGEKRVLMRLVGEGMKRSGGRIDANRLREELEKVLS